jgi:transposase
MAERLVNVDRETVLLLPPDMRQWVPEDDLVHFVIEAVEGMVLPAMEVNRRGTGSEQYPPRMMLALIVYSYANGLFGSRRIERATYRDVAVRYLCGDTHPDHDTICAFRRQNAEVVKQAFLEVLRLAKEMKLLKVGTVSVDGTQIRANASKHKSLRYDRAGQLERQLSQDIEELLRKAEQQDSEPEADEQRLPQEIARRERLREKMREARGRLEERARAQAAKRQPPQGGEGSGSGQPETLPKDSQQINLTDADSALMRKSKRHSYEQAYNAQAVVDADGSQLVLVTEVLNTPSDANQLEPAVKQVQQTMGAVQRVLADGGYVNADGFERVQQRGVEPFVAISDEEQNVRQYDYRPPRERQLKKLKDVRLIAMREKLRSDEGRKIYAKRAYTVEPVFGIIKAALGFRQFLLRGLPKVRVEWDLVCLAYNMKRLHSLEIARATA